MLFDQNSNKNGRFCLGINLNCNYQQHNPPNPFLHLRRVPHHALEASKRRNRKRSSQKPTIRRKLRHPIWNFQESLGGRPRRICRKTRGSGQRLPTPSLLHLLRPSNNDNFILGHFDPCISNWGRRYQFGYRRNWPFTRDKWRNVTNCPLIGICIVLGVHVLLYFQVHPKSD